MCLQPLHRCPGSLQVLSRSPVSTPRCSVERQTAPPQMRSGMTVVPGGIGLLMRTGRGLAGPSRAMEVHSTSDAQGADEAARVGGSPPCVDNHRFCTCLRCHADCTNEHRNNDESWTRRDAVALWTSAYSGRVEPIATCTQWKY